MCFTILYLYNITILKYRLSICRLKDTLQVYIEDEIEGIEIPQLDDPRFDDEIVVCQAIAIWKIAADFQLRQNVKYKG